MIRIEDGAAVIDLFGKALAVMDAFEPAEIAEITAETETEEPTEGAVEAGEAESAAEAEGTPGAEAIEAGAEVIEAEAAPEPAPVDDAETVPAAADAAQHAPDADAAPAAGEEAQAAKDETDEGELDDETSAGSVAAVSLPPEVEAYQVPALAESSPEVGSIFRGRVVSVSESGHVAIVNRAIDKPLVKARLRAIRGERVSVMGLVFGFNRGGFDVLVDGVRCFCPASGMAFESIEDPSEYVAKKLEFTLPPAKGAGRSLVVTRRALLERERRRAARERFKSLEAGQRFEGRVVDVRDFGAVIDIGGGVEGLVHASELSWTRGSRPADEVKRGDLVNVEVLEVRPPDRLHVYPDRRATEKP